MLFRTKSEMVAVDSALPGRPEETPVPARHAVLGTPLQPPWPEGMHTAVFGMGCFWGSEELYWLLPGVYSTAVGYAGGYTANPTYEETCSGRTGHAEVVLVVYDPAKVTYDDLLAVFWENHDPTLGMRQGNDVGTQYRSAILTTSAEQQAEAEASRDRYQQALNGRGLDPITTEIAPLGEWYYAESYHQQYLHHHPHGYRCHARSGAEYPR